jgi:hypothetical protein
MDDTGQRGMNGLVDGWIVEPRDITSLIQESIDPLIQPAARVFVRG